jgi:hypothetical protein
MMTLVNRPQFEFPQETARMFWRMSIHNRELSLLFARTRQPPSILLMNHEGRLANLHLNHRVFLRVTDA